jgi:alkylation response protein AidB-like acyl-CoA dehydrogenase
VKHDRLANAVEQVDFGPYTRQLRREVAQFGVLTKTKSELHKFSLIYYLGHLGEGSVTCGMSCTDGAIRAIEARGSQLLRETYLPKLRSIDTPLAGAQFITEQDGGSDVGAIETAARVNPDGTWSISGEKWFCSNPDEYFVIAARPEGASAGTDGIGLFLVPRVLMDATPNGLSFRRLKDKLGSALPPPDRISGSHGFASANRPEFKTLMSYVINASRIRPR